MVQVSNVNQTAEITQELNMAVPFFCFTERSTACYSLLEAKWSVDANKTLRYVHKKINPGSKYKDFVKEPAHSCCMKGMVKKSELGAFAYYGDRTSQSYRAYGKQAKKLSNQGFSFAYVKDMAVMQEFDETLQDEKDTALIFIDTLFGQKCKYEGLADDKKHVKVWM